MSTDTRARAQKLRALHSGDMLILPNVWDAASATVVADAGVPIVINARVDVYLRGSRMPVPDRLGEAIRRGHLYRDAGADCIYPIGVRDRHDLTALVAELSVPVNGNPGGDLDLATLRDIGVARVSYGPRFYRAALADLETAVRSLR